jgi:hypothetical protein
MWIEFGWASTLLGLDRPGAVGYAARAARAADRQEAPTALDFSLHVLGIAAAEAGMQEQAALLIGYAATHFTTFETDEAQLAWLHARYRNAFGDTPQSEAAAAMHRRDLMALIDDVEGAFSRAEA